MDQMLDLAPEKSEISSILNPNETTDEFDDEINAAKIFEDSSQEGEKKAGKKFKVSKRVLLILILLVTNGIMLLQNIDLRDSNQKSEETINYLKLELMKLRELPTPSFGSTNPIMLYQPRKFSIHDMFWFYVQFAPYIMVYALII